MTFSYGQYRTLTWSRQDYSEWAIPFSTALHGDRIFLMQCILKLNFVPAALGTLAGCPTDSGSTYTVFGTVTADHYSGSMTRSSTS